MVNAIILAGDSKGFPVKDVANKALIKIKGRFMVEYIIESLRHAKFVDKIIVVGSEELRHAVGDIVTAVIECEDSIIKNTKLGIDFFGENEHIIICTCDIPLVSSEAIDDFIKQCTDKNADIGYPIIEKSLNDRKYPDVKRTYVKMKDGIYTGGNIIYVNPVVIKSCYSIAEELVENRKNAIKMGRTLGIWTLIRLCLGILKIQSVEKRANKILGVNARAIETLYPEIGNDVDKIEDVDFVNKYINISA